MMACSAKVIFDRRLIIVALMPLLPGVTLLFFSSHELVYQSGATSDDVIHRHVGAY
jgi:hypothetical protein|eukprot:COSAG02_NODE_1719_length_11197_cov_12.067039_3_plen_56_part_00